jgi:ABC-2 type transport system permease protein
MNAVTDTSEAIAAPRDESQGVKPFYWSLRRELWEHRSLMITPLVTIGVIFAAFLLAATIDLPDQLRILGTLAPHRQHAIVSGILLLIALAVALVMSFAVFFYCLDALLSERRDRSILFWKSMPVSDTTTVLSKLFTATLSAGAIAFVCILVAQVAVLVVATIAGLADGASIAPLWSNVQFVQILIATIYILLASALWYAPVAAWLLLVSAWAKRSAILWAVIPPVAIVVFERVAFRTHYVSELLEYRLKHGLFSAFQGGFVVDGGGATTEIHMGQRFPGNVLEILDPVGFLSNPWLWVGLVVAAAFTAAAIWLRRYREPI